MTEKPYKSFTKKEWEELQDKIFLLYTNLNDIRKRDIFMVSDFIDAVVYFVDRWGFDSSELPNNLSDEVDRRLSEIRFKKHCEDRE